MAADLQMHTEASDGKNTIEERAEQAREEGLDAIAITDHDTISNELEPGSQVIEGVEVITGAEIKCEVDGVGIEILGYFLDPEDESMEELFDEMERNRRERMEEMVQNVNEGEGLDLTVEDVEEYAEGTLGRPHLGMALEDIGRASSVNEAFDEYIGEEAGTGYYVETEKLPAEKAIDLVHQNGGVCSLSHPGRDLPYEEADEIVSELADDGLDALEVWYTYEHKIEDGFDISFAEHLQEQGMKEPEEIADRIQQEVNILAEKYDLIKTGGSDCHGEGSGKYNIGEVSLDGDYVDQLRAAKQSAA